MLLACAPLAADEVRLIYTLGMEDLDFSPRDGESYDDEWDDNERYEIGAFSNLGMIWGFGIGTQRAELAHEDWTLDYESWNLRIYSGQALAQTESFSFEIVGYTGLGMATAELGRSAPGAEDASDRDFLLEFGAQANLTLSLTRLFFVGAGVGYGWSQTKLDLDGKRDLDQQGLHYFGYAGLRF